MLTVAPDVLGQVIAAQIRAPKRAKVLRALADAPETELTTAALREAVGDCRDALNALCKMGFVKLEKRESLRRPYGAMERLSERDPRLTRQQEDVLAAELLPAVERGQGGFLLYGVTGSGKTEVYIRLVRRALEVGKSADRPRAGDRPHAADGLLVPSSASARTRPCSIPAFRRASDSTSGGASGAGEARVVIGARSAVFAPLANVGVIVVDEEHEGSYQSDRRPPLRRPRGRHGGARRARARCCSWAAPRRPCASYMRSMPGVRPENRLTLIELPERVGGRPLPEVEVVDMRREFERGNRSHLQRPPLGWS